MSNGTDIVELSERPAAVVESHRTGSRVDSFVRVHAGRIAVALCLFAVARIWIFAAAFPLFNTLDEKLHFLSIRMYAQGHLPGKGLPLFDNEFARSSLPYWSPEYDHSPDFIRRNGLSQPLYRLTPQARGLAMEQGYYARKLEGLLQRRNFQAQGPPLYYLVAGAWYRIGGALGMHDWGLKYWLRFLNPMAYGIVVWLSYKVSRKLYSDSTFLCLAVPALIAVFPQDVFFGMSRDVLSPLLCTGAFLFMLKAVSGEPNQNRSLLFAAFLVGLAFLVEVSNFVWFSVMAITLWVFGIRNTGRSKFMVISGSLLAAGAPPLLWMLRNYLVMDDLTAARAKAHDLTWTFKPLSEMFRHPLFSFHGLTYFLFNLTRTFWRGELIWHGLRMSSPIADMFYVLSSLVLVVVFGVTSLMQRKDTTSLQCLAAIQAFLLMAGSVLFLAVISLCVDFHDCEYPSRVYPYFTSGRIICGVLLPFVLIYANGLRLVTNWLSRWIPPIAVLSSLIFVITAFEIRVRSVAFSSPYNFFALSSWYR
jgi:hypothetical protein